MSWFKKIFLILAVFGLATPFFVFADNFGIDSAAQGTALIQNSLSIPELIGSIVGIALSFVGIVFFLLILYAGFLWMTAFGNEEKVTTSKSIMEHAAIGLIIVLSAYAISQFVFGALTLNGGSSQTSPQTKVAGESCGDNSVWNDSGVCVSECVYLRAGVCQDQNVNCAQTYESGFCPGLANIKCCPLAPL